MCQNSRDPVNRLPLATLRHSGFSEVSPSLFYCRDTMPAAYSLQEDGFIGLHIFSPWCAGSRQSVVERPGQAHIAAHPGSQEEARAGRANALCRLHTQGHL